MSIDKDIIVGVGWIITIRDEEGGCTYVKPRVGDFFKNKKRAYLAASKLADQSPEVIQVALVQVEEITSE